MGWTHERAILANAVRHGHGEQAVAAARARLAAAREQQTADEHIDAIAAAAGALTPEQSDRLRALLPAPRRGGESDAA